MIGMAHIHELYDFTASAFILHPTEEKLCLLKHKKLNVWLQPGGHVELDEDPLEALTHELIEETGLNPEQYDIIQSQEQPSSRGSKSLPIPMHFNVHEFNDKHRHIDLEYLVKSKAELLAPQKGESQQIGWFTLDQIIELHSKKELFDGTLDICNWIFNNHM